MAKNLAERNPHDAWHAQGVRRYTRAAAALLFGGAYGAAFWTLVVAMGLATPLVAEWIEARHGLAPGRIPAVLVLLGGFALRWIVVYAGQESSLLMQTAMR